VRPGGDGGVGRGRQVQRILPRATLKTLIERASQ
jgi:hypothetical protein